MRLRLRARTLSAISLAVCAAACTRSRGTRANASPPTAEFLVSTADSTFWVSTGAAGVRVRGEPLTLAHLDGRFYELYTADDDYSYPDAMLLGERLYRRDLRSGDSAVVFVDTIVPRIAATYARAHPDDQPLGPDEDTDADPGTSAAADIDILGVLGPYVSYEYDVDVQVADRHPWTATQRGVIDLRTRRRVAIADLFGASAGAALVEQGRRLYLDERDSVLRALRGRPENARRAANALRTLHFDPASFTLDESEGQPAVTFAVPARGNAAATHVVELDPLPVPAVSWWPTLLNGYPREDGQGADRWRQPDYQIIARYDTSGEIARLWIADRAQREWPIAAVSSPIQRIDWLDRPAVSALDRRALVRAFNEAASYDETTRVASATGPADRHLVSNSRHAPIQDCSRKPARNLRAHDAGARQQHGARVRRRDPVHDGQVRGDRCIPSQPRERRHGVD
jgi:hypothetical protein